jgi:hypothetical protein
MEKILEIQKEIEPLQKILINHNLYQNINSTKDIQSFMQMHVFAVWDFMSLLKALQCELTCTQPPWKATKNRLSRRLINEIVLCEESDYNELNVTMSHFEMYIDAMKQCNANTHEIEIFMANIETNNNYSEAINSIELVKEVKEFMDFTFEVINTKEAHLIAAAFTFGRENLVPDIFVALVKKFNKEKKEDLSKFVYYLDRHIEVDGEEHGPMALNMIKELCGDDDKKWSDAKDVSVEALLKRIKLWDSINSYLIKTQKS